MVTMEGYIAFKMMAKVVLLIFLFSNLAAVIYFARIYHREVVKEAKANLLAVEDVSKSSPAPIYLAISVFALIITTICAGSVFIV